MKKILLFLIFISNCFAAEVKDVGERKMSAEIEGQQFGSPQTQSEIVNQQDALGNTPLHKAVNENDKWIVALLLTAGANPWIKNLEGKTPKDLAKSGEIGDLLQDYEDLWVQNGEDLVAAALIGDSKKVAEILRSRFVDVNYQTIHSYAPFYNATPLITALRMINSNSDRFEQYLKIINMLLQAKADVNIRDGRGLTALMWAASRDLPDIVRILIDNGAIVDLQDYFGDTVLKWLANYKENKNILEIIKILLDAKANPNTQNKFGSTPLTAAIENRFPEMVNLLIKAGADVNVKNANGDTPLITTIDKLSSGRYWKTYEEIIKLLLNAKADVNITNKEGHSALFLTIPSRNENIVKMLLKNGANVNLQSKIGKTVLMIAAFTGQEDIAELLIDAGADINLKDINGETAKDIAKNRGRSNIVDLISKIEEKEHLERIREIERESSILD